MMKLKRVESVEGFPRLEIKYRNKLPNDVYGLCHADNGMIELSLKQNTTQEMMDSTLLHELCHLALYRSGWGEILEAANLTEEGLVIMLETAFRGVVSFVYKKDIEKPKV